MTNISATSFNMHINILKNPKNLYFAFIHRIVVVNNLFLSLFYISLLFSSSSLPIVIGLLMCCLVESGGKVGPIILHSIMNVFLLITKFMSSDNEMKLWKIFHTPKAGGSKCHSQRSHIRHLDVRTFDSSALNVKTDLRASDYKRADI